MTITRVLAAALCALLSLATPAGAADTIKPLIIWAGKADSPYHALARQFAEAVALAGNDALTLEVQESQGSVQNIIAALKPSPNYIFTAPPNLIAQAKRGEKPFQHDPAYAGIRALFPIPPLTMHWVVRADSDVTGFSGLAGHPFLPGGKGSFGERQTAAALHALGIESQVELIDLDISAAPAALLNKQVVGVALAGAYPLPLVTELAQATPIRLLSLTPSELAAIVANDDSVAAQIIPQGTYPGVAQDITSIAQPAGAYTTRQMSEATAYAITKAFWAGKEELARRNPPWQAVTPATLAALGAKLHPGAQRYYREAGIAVPPALR